MVLGGEPEKAQENPSPLKSPLRAFPFIGFALGGLFSLKEAHLGLKTCEASHEAAEPLGIPATSFLAFLIGMVSNIDTLVPKERVTRFPVRCS